MKRAGWILKTGQSEGRSPIRAEGQCHEAIGPSSSGILVQATDLLFANQIGYLRQKGLRIFREAPLSAGSSRMPGYFRKRLEQ